MRPGKRIFYGWWVVGVTTVALIFGYSSFFAVIFAQFVTILETEFGWNRTTISFGATLGIGAAIFLAPLAGVLVDRFGVRQILLPSVVAFGLATASLALLTDSLFHFYGVLFLIAIAGLGTQPVCYSRIILNWFDRHRGLALGIALSGVGLAIIVLPPLIQILISVFGWRGAFLCFGLVVIAVIAPANFYILKENPETLGLQPDGREEADPSKGRPADTKTLPAGLDLEQTLRDRAFWYMVAAFFLLGIASLGLATHLAAMLSDNGANAVQISLAYAVYGSAAIVGRIGCGYLVDRYHATIVGPVLMLCSAFGLLLLSFQGPYAATLFAAVLIGIGFGAEFDLMSFLVSRYIGLRTYGKIYGLLYGIFGVGGAIGPLLMGWTFDQFGSYGPALAMLTATPFIAAVLFRFMGSYRWAASSETESADPKNKSVQAAYSEAPAQLAEVSSNNPVDDKHD